MMPIESIDILIHTNENDDQTQTGQIYCSLQWMALTKVLVADGGVSASATNITPLTAYINNGQVNIRGHVYLDGLTPTSKIPSRFKFNIIDGACYWTSRKHGDCYPLELMPRIVRQTFSIPHPKITHLPKFVNTLRAIKLVSIRDLITIKCTIESRRLIVNPDAMHALNLLNMPIDRVIAPLGNSHPVWMQIINHHLANGRDIIACQDQLLEAGFFDQASL